MTASPERSFRRLADNRKAFRDYFVLERFEAGIELRGTEVKSARAGHVSLASAFASVDNGEIILRDLNINPYDHGNRFNHDPARPRRLLMHRREIDRLQGQVEQKRLTLIPLSVYLKKGFVKIELGLCRGKQQQDKREDIKRRDANRDAQRAMAAARRR
jgi:SsrA-binding protein